MSKTSSLSVSIAALLAGCATIPLDEGGPGSADYLEATELSAEAEPQIIETVTPVPLPGQLKKVPAPRLQPKALSPERAIEKGASNARIEPSLAGYMNAVQIYPYTEGALYRLYAAPGQVSDIALQPGEELVSVSAGDTVRWVVGDTSSGAGDTFRAHVLVKPIAPSLSTNLMIATDRRVYHLELQSTEATYMAALSWRYPQDEFAQTVARRDSSRARKDSTIVRELPINNLSFDYRIEGDRPDWRPVRAFDDGSKVFIQMPDHLGRTQAPPLFVLGSKGRAELVNYRVSGKYYVVDRLFAAAELRLGEKPQTIVRIVRTGRASRAKA